MQPTLDNYSVQPYKRANHILSSVNGGGIGIFVDEDFSAPEAASKDLTTSQINYCMRDWMVSWWWWNWKSSTMVKGEKGSLWYQIKGVDVV